jgi:nitroimidazol reductase NimA-like FMN-containing flavoprotein (pyridoxamine 5'-phosphate oxidase superfamily)
LDYDGRMSLNPTMTREEREAFLADVHVGVLSVAEPDRGPCAVPVWYRYTPGDVVRITVPPHSRKAELLRNAGRASLVAQTETLPYKYVSVEGPVEVLEQDVSADQREIATRYMGDERAALYLSSMPGLATEVLVILRPERWWSVDFARVKLG